MDEGIASATHQSGSCGEEKFVVREFLFYRRTAMMRPASRSEQPVSSPPIKAKQTAKQVK
jgi:hypothetical protein